ncbi:MAG: prolyl aminopeptidase [Betaproteobacteria bacterium]
MSTLYPPLEPHRTGHLDVTGGHRVWFEESGNPRGRPVLFLHGGPGSATKPDHRRYFDPSHYRIVLFDQRGCGRSEPTGHIDDNTTAHLLDDMEKLRATLGIERWLLFGGSWGSTLALAYAQARPQQVTGLILRGIFLASADELDWYFLGLRRFIPEAWESLWGESSGCSWPYLVSRYQAALHQPDRVAAMAAAARWNAFETAVMSIGETQPMTAPTGTDEAGLARARVQVHYLANDCFLRPGQLLDDMPRIAHLPAVILHGRQDFVCPPSTAFDLKRRWPVARLTYIEQAKHAASHPALERELVAAADAARDTDLVVV